MYSISFFPLLFPFVVDLGKRWGEIEINLFIQ